MARRATAGPLPTSRLSGAAERTQAPASCWDFGAWEEDREHRPGMTAGIVGVSRLLVDTLAKPADSHPRLLPPGALHRHASLCWTGARSYPTLSP